MSRTRTRRTATVLALMGVIVLFAAGCDCPKRLRVLQDQNEMLTERVAELENQLMQADAAAAAAMTGTQTPAGETAYVVVQGDSLWSIAKKQLGKGSRYEEILALNPHISQDKPLAIGTILKLPPR